MTERCVSTIIYGCCFFFPGNSSVTHTIHGCSPLWRTCCWDTDLLIASLLSSRNVQQLTRGRRSGRTCISLISGPYTLCACAGVCVSGWLGAFRGMFCMRVCNVVRSTNVSWIAQQTVTGCINQTLSHLILLRSVLTNCSFNVYLRISVGEEGCLLEICFLRLYN